MDIVILWARVAASINILGTSHLPASWIHVDSANIIGHFRCPYSLSVIILGCSKARISQSHLFRCSKLDGNFPGKSVATTSQFNGYKSHAKGIAKEKKSFNASIAASLDHGAIIWYGWTSDTFPFRSKFSRSGAVDICYFLYSSTSPVMSLSSGQKWLIWSGKKWMSKVAIVIKVLGWVIS